MKLSSYGHEVNWSDDLNASKLLILTTHLDDGLTLYLVFKSVTRYGMSCAAPERDWLAPTTLAHDVL